MAVQRRRVLVPLFVAALVAAGCGSDEAADEEPVPASTGVAPTTAEQPPASAATTDPAGTTGEQPADEPIGGGGDVPSAELTIRVWPDGRGAGEPDTYTLTCLPDAGTLPDPVLACEAVRSVPFIFAPPPTDQMCTEQYGGPAVAEVEGRVQDIAVDEQFSRVDGCAIARWDQAAPLLPLDGAGAPG
jgi:hypothetical protein